MMEKQSSRQAQGIFRNGLLYKEVLMRKNPENFHHQERHLHHRANELRNSQQQDKHLDMEVSMDKDQVAWLKDCFVGQTYELEQ
ncbi:hypothetical protein Ancab_028392, partial [Ancistrocladus abbreviatus]